MNGLMDRLMNGRSTNVDLSQSGESQCEHGAGEVLKGQVKAILVKDVGTCLVAAVVAKVVIVVVL